MEVPVKQHGVHSILLVAAFGGIRRDCPMSANGRMQAMKPLASNNP